MIRFIPRLLALMGIFFLITGVTAYFTVSYLIKASPPVTVPDFTGQDLLSVLETLTRLELNFRLKGTQYSMEVPENQILFQDPAPGEVVKKGRDVRIVVSRGTKILSMPDLKGITQHQAGFIIQENGLDMGTVSKTFHSAVPREYVVSQYPPAGRQIERNTKIDLLLSRGPRPGEFVMPDFYGLYLDEAVLTARKNHLLADTIKTRHETGPPANSVLAQHPAPGSHYAENQSLTLEVNRREVSGAAFLTAGKTLFQYQSDPGFLKHHIRIELKAFHATLVLHDALTAPDTILWAVVPPHTVAVIFVYKNDELIKSEIFD